MAWRGVWLSWVETLLGALLLATFAAPTFGQSLQSAQWTGGAGTPNWSSQQNWNCSYSDGSNKQCVPSGAGVFVDTGGGQIVLDTSAGVGLLNINGGSLSASGTSLSASQIDDQGQLSLDSGATFTSGSYLNVGDSGTSGTLNIETGAVVTDATANLGNFNGAIGQATVDGQGSQWNSSGYLLVGGDGGNGTLTIENGAVVTSVSGSAYGTGSGIGGNIYAAGTGLVTVTGAGSRWNNTGFLGVGGGGSPGGNGTLNITSGAIVTDTRAGIGDSNGSMGRVTVDGQGSQWNNSSYLEVGDSADGNGTLKITNAAVVGDTYSEIGDFNGATGQVTVDGQGSQWDNSGYLQVGGGNGDGTLTIENGAMVTSGSDGTFSAIGGDSSGGGTGLVTVTGVGSQWKNSDHLEVGDGAGGNGTLNINDAAVVSDTYSEIGDVSGATGQVTIDGQGSQWANSGYLQVGGGNGNGTLTIENGALVTSGSDATFSAIGGDSSGGGTGLVTVTGAGSQWKNSDHLEVGDGASGNGTLNINAGAVVSDTYSGIGNFNRATGQVTVDGQGSQWNNSGYLLVGGDGGNGTLTIENGAVVTSASGTSSGSFSGIGGNVDAAGTGLVTVTGEGSQWNNTGSLGVGEGATPGGDGTLNIENGGVVSSGGGDIGETTGSTGQVTVDGAGSQWNLSGTLIIGDTGTGTLTLQNGGTVTGGDPVIGSEAGSTGTFIVAGSSEVDFTDALTVGKGGDGKMSLSEGAVVANTDGTVAEEQTSTSSATIAGPGSEWRVGGDLKVGDAGNGTVTVSQSGTLTSDSGTVGAQATSTNSSVTITDGGSVWNDSGDLTVGENGTGALTIENGGVVNSANDIAGSEAKVGAGAGSSGIVTVTGAASQWNDSGNLTVGESGTGSLMISQGASVNNAVATVGAQQGATGTVTVTDPGSLWASAGDLTVGESGAGTMTIQNSAAVTDNLGTVGGEATAVGTVKVAGAAWTNAGSLTVGDKGQGNLTISDGGTLGSTGGKIGDSAGGSGMVTVDSGAQWNANGEITVGGSGDGALAMASGSTVSSQGLTIGESTGGMGDVAVGGSGTTLTDSSDLTAGSSGQGGLTILDGGKVSDTEGRLGENTGSQGTATVEGVWNNSQDLTVGDSGTGTLTVDGSGVVMNANGDIASIAGSSGAVTVQGSGSNASVPAWLNNGSLKVGDGGTGKLDVLNGGSVVSQSGVIGGAKGSQGAVKVDGQGSQWKANAPGDSGTIEIGMDQGVGKLTVSSGGTVIADTIEIGSNGTLDGVGGIVNANVDVNGGTVSPGDPGSMTVNGNFDLTAGSTLTLEIASLTNFDSLNITGTGTFDGIVNLDFIDGFVPVAGDSFNFITDAGGLFDPSSLNFIGVTPAMYTSDLSAGFELTTTSDFQPSAPSPTPEPAALPLFAMGLIAMLWFARRAPWAKAPA